MIHVCRGRAGDASVPSTLHRPPPPLRKRPSFIHQKPHHRLVKLSRLIEHRHMTRLFQYEQPCAFNLLPQNIAKHGWHKCIVLAPDEQRGGNNVMQGVADVFGEQVLRGVYDGERTGSQGIGEEDGQEGWFAVVNGVEQRQQVAVYGVDMRDARR